MTTHTSPIKWRLALKDKSNQTKIMDAVPALKDQNHTGFQDAWAKFYCNVEQVRQLQTISQDDAAAIVAAAEHWQGNGYNTSRASR